MKKKKTKSNIDFESDRPAPTKGELSRVSDLTVQLTNLNQVLAGLQTQAEVTQRKIDQIQFEELPTLMQGIGLSDFRLTDGTRVVIKPFIKASLPTDNAIARCKDPDERLTLQARMAHGLAYLRKNGAGALIKNMLKADFGRESEQLARKAMRELQKLGVRAELTKGVHPQTLTAWVKERLEAGKPVDMETFAVFSGSQAKITKAEIKEQETVTNEEGW